MKTFLGTGVGFGIIMGLFYTLLSRDIYEGIFAGIFGGVFFAFFITVFLQIQKRKFKKISSEITNGQNIILDGGANHFIGKEAVGGWLYLTSEGVVFKSHAFNVKCHQLVIPFDSMVEVKTALTLGIVPNGLHIVTTDGVIERFVVNDRKNWIKKINGTILAIEN